MIDKYLLMYLFTATRGGMTRAKIVISLKKKAMNLHQLSKHLLLDYKTVQHHIKILLDNNVISAINKGNYGALYYISAEMEVNYVLFESIWRK